MYASIIWQVHTLCNISPCWYSGTIAYRYASIIWQVHTLCNISPCWYSGTIAYRYASIIWQVHTLCNISPCWYSGTIASAFLIWAQTTRRTLPFLMPSTRLFLHTLWSLPCKYRSTEFTFSYSKLLRVSHIISGKNRRICSTKSTSIPKWSQHFCMPNAPSPLSYHPSTNTTVTQNYQPILL